MDPRKKQRLVDDLESFLHVVTWLALCFSSHSLSQESLEELLLRVFDEGHVERSGLEVGGGGKRDALVGGGIAATVKFKDRLKLDALLKVLANHLASRYECENPVEGKPELQKVLLAYRQERISNLQTSDWMLNQGRVALQV